MIEIEFISYGNDFKRCVKISSKPCKRPSNVTNEQIDQICLHSPNFYTRQTHTNMYTRYKHEV